MQGLTTSETLLDVLPYKVTNILGAALNGSYAVTIHGTNDTPVAPSVSVSVQEDTLLLSSGIIAATDPDNTRDGIVSDLLSFTPQTTAGLYGTLTLNANGAYTYTLNNSLSVVQALGQDESLSETFNYTVKDQHGRHHGRHAHREHQRHQRFARAHGANRKPHRRRQGRSPGFAAARCPIRTSTTS